MADAHRNAALLSPDTRSGHWTCIACRRRKIKCNVITFSSMSSHATTTLGEQLLTKRWRQVTNACLVTIASRPIPNVSRQAQVGLPPSLQRAPIRSAGTSSASQQSRKLSSLSTNQAEARSVMFLANIHLGTTRPSWSANGAKYRISTIHQGTGALLVRRLGVTLDH